MALTREQLKDGKVLSALIENYLTETTETSLSALFSCLRDSVVLVPHFAINKEGIICEGADADEDCEFVPDVLESEGYSFFPVFSSEDTLGGDYGKKVMKKEMHILEVIDFAKGMPDVTGIVVDAFTAPFILEREMYDVLASLPSNIEE
ncbi:MAG: SseB family protein [Eubacterium sp.]|nr:SseB family protein [Eubacterium sp.]